MRVNNEIMDAKAGVFTAPIKWAKTWEELGEIKGLYVDKNSKLEEFYKYSTTNKNKNIFATEKQAEQYGIVAAQLSQLVANLNGEPNWKSSDSAFKHYYYCIIINNQGDLCIERNPLVVFPFPIKTKEAAEFSLKHHADLWRKFYGI